MPVVPLMKPARSVTAAGTVADVVVAIVAKSDIDNAPLRKMLHVLQVMVQGQSVLDAQQNALTPFALVLIEVSGSAGNAEITAVAPHNVLNLIENEIGV